MDLDEWEYLPDDGFLDFQEEKEEKRIFSSSKPYSDSKSIFNMNYFIIPSPPTSRKVIGTPPPPPIPPPEIHSRVPNQFVPVPIQLELPPSFVNTSEENEEVNKVVPMDHEKMTSYKAADDQDTQLSQVYFKKTWGGNEFADMKMDTPTSPTCRSPRFMHQSSTTTEAMETKITSPRTKTIEINNFLEPEESKEEDDDDQAKSGTHKNNNNNIWKLSLTGVGAICSFGFAAATICILFFGTHQQRNKQYQHNQNHFQIYSDDNKKIKQAVEHATKLNEAFSAVRGVPLTRAHVTYGGYYSGL